MRKITLKSATTMLAVIFIAVIALSCAGGSFAQSVPVSNVTSATDFSATNIYAINSASDLKQLAEKVNSGHSMSGVKFVLAADIVLNAGTFDTYGNWSESGTPQKWTPIGDALNPFSGTFDGQGHTVSGMYCDSTLGFQGLFGHIVDGSVENLNIKDSYVSGWYYVGGIAGYACALSGESYIKNCTLNLYTSCVNEFGGAVAGCVRTRGTGSFTISQCTTVSNSPVAGITEGDFLSVSGNNETVQKAPSAKDMSWLWIVLILLVCIVIVIILLIVFRKKDDENSENSEPEKSTPAELDTQATDDSKETTEIAAEADEAPEAEPEEKPDEAAVGEPESVPGSDSEQSTESDPAAIVADPVIVEPEKPKPLGYYYIKQTANGGYMFNLKAANHEIIATSEVYTTLSGCKKGIQSVAKSAPNADIDDMTDSVEEKIRAPKFDMYLDKGGKFRFRLKAGNYEIIAVSQTYSSKNGCKNGIDSVIRNAATTKIIIEDAETGERREKLRAEIKKAEKVTVEEANELIDDTTAEVLVETMNDEDEPWKKLSCDIINIDTISENFEDGDVVNTAALIEKGLIPAKTKHIKVLARGTLDKALTVEANQFSVDAIKMIVLVGGTAIRTN